MGENFHKLDHLIIFRLSFASLFMYVCISFPEDLSNDVSCVGGPSSRGDSPKPLFIVRSRYERFVNIYFNDAFLLLFN